MDSKKVQCGQEGDLGANGRLRARNLSFMWKTLVTTISTPLWRAIVVVERGATLRLVRAVTITKSVRQRHGVAEAVCSASMCALSRGCLLGGLSYSCLLGTYIISAVTVVAGLRQACSGKCR